MFCTISLSSFQRLQAKTTHWLNGEYPNNQGLWAAGYISPQVFAYNVFKLLPLSLLLSDYLPPLHNLLQGPWQTTSTKWWAEAIIIRNKSIPILFPKHTLWAPVHHRFTHTINNLYQRARVISMVSLEKKIFSVGPFIYLFQLNGED